MPLQDGRDGLPCELGRFGQLADQVVLHGRTGRAGQVVGVILLHYERVALFHGIVSGLVLLLARGYRVLERCYFKFLVEGLDALFDQLVGLEIHRINGLTVDAAPKLLELFLLKVRVERVDLAFAIIVDLGELSGAKHAVDEL